MNVNNGNSLLPEDRIKEFKSMLSENGASENTVRVYAASVREFYKNHQELTVDELQDYKRELLKKYRPATVNTRIYGINQYVKYQKKQWNYGRFPASSCAVPAETISQQYNLKTGL